MEGTQLIPAFGPLQGVRVVVAGSLIAAPFAASMMSDLGAEVILIERPHFGDPNRKMGYIFWDESGEQGVSAGFMQAARNRLSMTLDLNLKQHPESREIFFSLMKKTDILLENLVWLDKYGISDEELLSLNPQLVICHVSGYGNEAFGGPGEYCGRASYDIIAQAFSGYMDTNGEEDGPPMRVSCYLNDYTTAAWAAFGALGAYIHRLKTGKGQAVDISQVEVQSKFMHDAFVLYSLTGMNPLRTGNMAPASQPYGIYPCKNGDYVALGAVSVKVFQRLLAAIGLHEDSYYLYDISGSRENILSPAGREFDRLLRDWLLSHTAEEIDAIMAEHHVPCSKVNKVEDCFKSPYFQERGDFVRYKDETLGREVTAFGIVPKYSDSPGEIWRGAPSIGQDTERILRDLLGKTPEEITDLRQKALI